MQPTAPFSRDALVESGRKIVEETEGPDAGRDVKEVGVGVPLYQALHRQAHVSGLILLSFVISFGAFFMDGNVGINLADEGYLWYGMTAVNAGFVPMRDFHAYDPGRYFWLAGWSRLLGDSLVSMRAGCVLFQCLGMVCGLLAARRLSRDWKFLLLVALILAQWMTPRYKLFEQSVGVMAIYAAVRLIEKQTLRQYFFTGIFIGLMAFMGRNHGVYQVGAFGLIMLRLASGEWAQLPRRALRCAAGIAVGYLPQWLMFAFVPGYFGAYVAQLQCDLSGGSALPSPVPWPWRMPEGLTGVAQWGFLAEGAVFIALPVFVVVALTWIWKVGREEAIRHPVLLGAACVTAFYAHHSFSRPDWVHLAHSAPALALCIIAICHIFGARFQRWLPIAAALTLVAGSVSAMALHTGLVQEALSPAGTFVEVRVRGRMMHVPKYFAGLLGIADHVANRLAKPDEPVAFLPHWPGLYPATNRFSPTKQIYFILPMPSKEEDLTIAALKEKRVKWVVLQDYKLDGRDDLRFHRTNPRTFAYFRANFQKVDMPELPTSMVVLRLRE